MRQFHTLILLLVFTLAGMAGSLLLGLAIWNAPSAQDQSERIYHTGAVVAEWWVALGSVGLVLFFLWEGRHFVKTLASSNYSHIYNRLDQINLLLVEQMDGRKLDLSEEVPDDYDFPFTDPRTHLCDMVFSLYEEAFYQRIKFGTLDDEDWEQWRNSLGRVLNLPFVRKYWQEFQAKSYPLKFQALVQEVRRNQAPIQDAPPGKISTAMRMFSSSWGGPRFGKARPPQPAGNCAPPKPNQDRKS